MKFLLALAIGLAGGYYLGFSDGSQGKPSVVTRIVERVGGNSRSKVTNDIDAAMDRLEGNGAADSKNGTKKSAKAP